MLEKRLSLISWLVVLVLSLLGVDPLLAQGSGVESTLLGRGLYEGEPLTIEIHAPVDVVKAMLTFQPGSASTWHYHPGSTFVVVKTGAVTLYQDEPGCPWTVYPAGSAFFEERGHVHIAVNETDEVTQVLPTYIVPPGSPTRVDVEPKFCGK